VQSQGHFYIKYKLQPRTDFNHLSSREPVVNHTVSWAEPVSFEVKTTSTETSGELNPVYLRVSVRKESQGGKSEEKLGVIEINLATFAGATGKEQRCLLQAANKKDKQQGKDNSILKLVITMKLLSGDPMFKVPDAVEASVTASASNEPAGSALKIADLETSLVRLANLAELTQRTSTDPRVREWCATRVSANTLVDSLLASNPPVFRGGRMEADASGLQVLDVLQPAASPLDLTDTLRSP
jgi:hypothetical protein